MGKTAKYPETILAFFFAPDAN